MYSQAVPLTAGEGFLLGGVSEGDRLEKVSGVDGG